LPEERVEGPRQLGGLVPRRDDGDDPGRGRRRAGHEPRRDAPAPAEDRIARPPEGERPQEPRHPRSPPLSCAGRLWQIVGCKESRTRRRLSRLAPRPYTPRRRAGLEPPTVPGALRWEHLRHLARRHGPGPPPGRNGPRALRYLLVLHEEARSSL